MKYYAQRLPTNQYVIYTYCKSHEIDEDGDLIEREVKLYIADLNLDLKPLFSNAYKFDLLPLRIKLEKVFDTF